ncbi:MAG TPA: YcxB family protein [Streptosporangiaceae bacterium]|jgi:hypothetical protein|nr:YcxB family protein [Streptosporangiaceae bacterium]
MTREQGGYVQISVHYTRDLKRTYRVTARLRRRTFNLFRVIGTLLVLLAGLGAWSAAFSVGTAVADTVMGILIFVLPDAALWLGLLRNRSVFVVDVDVEISDRGISSRTATQSTTLEWGMVKRVLETGDCWIFVVNRLQHMTLYKAALTPLQRGQLIAFLDARP